MERITVELISSKEFTVENRGYNRKEVDEFLDDVCDEMERMEAEIQDLRQKNTAVRESAAAAPAGVSSGDENRFREILEMAATVKEETIRKAKEDYVERGRAEIERKALAGRLASREYSPKQVTVIVACAAVILVMLAVYMITLSGVRASRTSVADMKLQDNRMAAGNELTEIQIRDTIDYTEVYRYATETLGMSLPGRQQVVTYGKNAQEYVTKGMDIPNE